MPKTPLTQRLEAGMSAADREIMAAQEVWRDASERIAVRWHRVAEIVDCTPDPDLRRELYHRLMEVAAAVDAKRMELGLKAPPIFRVLGRTPGCRGPIAATGIGLGAGILGLFGALFLVHHAWSWAAPERRWEAEQERSLDEILARIQQADQMTARQEKLIMAYEKGEGFVARSLSRGEDVARSMPHAGLKTWRWVRENWIVILTVTGIWGFFRLGRLIKRRS